MGRHLRPATVDANEGVYIGEEGTPDEIVIDWGEFRLTLRKEMAPGAQEVTITAERLGNAPLVGRRGVFPSDDDCRLTFRAARGAAIVRLLRAV